GPLRPRQDRPAPHDDASSSSSAIQLGCKISARLACGPMNSPQLHERPAVRELLGQPDFLRLWLVGAFANAMRWLELLASALFAFEVTGSALAGPRGGAGRAAAAVALAR